jgi:hypothetical protein
MELRVEHDVLAQERTQQVEQVGDHEVEVEHLGLHHLLAAEGEQLARERAGPGGGLQNFRDLGLGGGRLFGQIVVENLAITADGGEQVVEVVRHAAGEQAHGLHFLRLEQLLLALLEGGFRAVAGVHGAENVGDALEETRGVAREVARLFARR